MKTQKQEVFIKKSQLLLISVSLLVSFPANSEEKKDADYHYQAGKSAYEINRCSTATEHFEQYLEIAQVEQKKRTSIKSAIAWCKKYESTYVRNSKIMGFVAPGTYERQLLQESKPATATNMESPQPVTRIKRLY